MERLACSVQIPVSLINAKRVPWSALIGALVFCLFGATTARLTFRAVTKWM